ncbi:glyoxalase [Paenibacillus sp. SYP-B3998]|uniref:Glyoxalase n=1 Tax=Paenibacillus sp. SYP-B3998 TaxID=2678564 RepID=A0A6G3ZU92_9BACL|nr:VOC family protein [Paenibacillus sp. SYP-B3998]NEW05685.1 glyoxalase [Paenibacillus sp. SYP-B3998]
MNILKIEVRTKCLESIKQFYGDLLNFEIMEFSGNRMILQAGTSTIIFNEEDESEAFYHIAFSIPSNQLSEAKKWLENKGIELITKDNEDQFEFIDWSASACYFYDPDGNLIEFIAHHSIDHTSSDSFQAKSILHVSEIGLPVDDVRVETKRICERFGLSLWRGDGEQFAAIGDENGLFIVTDKNRPWFPDNRLPGMFPTAVTIKGKQELNLQMGRQLYLLNAEPSLV